MVSIYWYKAKNHLLNLTDTAEGLFTIKFKTFVLFIFSGMTSYCDAALDHLKGPNS
jgi:hypothetical protein